MIDIYKRKLQEVVSDFETSSVPYFYVTESKENLIFLYYGDERLKSEADIVEIKEKLNYVYDFGTGTLMQFFVNMKKIGKGKLIIFSVE